MTAKIKVQNLPGDTIEIQRSEPGQNVAVRKEGADSTDSVVFSLEF
jgi:hypothetical protein